MWKVQLFRLNFDQREAEVVAAVIESGWLTMGERTTSFESAFADFLGQATGHRRRGLVGLAGAAGVVEQVQTEGRRLEHPDKEPRAGEGQQCSLDGGFLDQLGSLPGRGRGSYP